MKTLIVCYSYTHNNLVLAGEILARTAGTLFVIEEKKTRSKFTILLDLAFRRVPQIKDFPYLLDQFDHYILIAPIWGGRIASPLKSFINKMGPRMSSYSFITVCGGAPDQKEKIINELATLMHKEPLMTTELSLSEYLGHRKGTLDSKIDGKQLNFFNNQIDEFLEEIGALHVIR
jgi:flavodoxin